MKYELGYGKVLISEETSKTTGLPVLTIAQVKDKYPIGLIVEKIAEPEIYNEIYIELHNLEGALVLQKLLERAISRFGEYKL
jgi:hypothetical protein